MAQPENLILTEKAQGLYKKALRLMGNRFEFSLVTDNPLFAEECFNAAIAEVKRLEDLLTTFSETSQTARINAMAGISPVKVDREVFDLILRANRISKLTQGAFDITYGSIDKRFWNFDTNMKALPSPAEANATVGLVNFRNITLDAENTSVFLKKRGMRIGFGGIGKGFAAEKAKAVLQAKGISSGIVNASGDLAVWGNQPNGEPWNIGIADPNLSVQPFSKLKLTNAAIATSGDYEKFVMIGGKRYSHTINPRTGLPATGVKSVTVICPNAELADALATPLLVMGVKTGMHLVNQLKQVACIYIDDLNRIHPSGNIRLTY
jgi:thiamine biosynthesis lipoprotein